MTAHFNVREIGIVSDELCPLAAWAWRGCCLELFSRAEHSVVDCLEVLEKAGIAISKDARNPFPMPRLKALKTCIRDHSFGGHERLAGKLLSSWERLCEERNWLAHALIKPTPDGIVAHHVSFDGKIEKRWPPKYYNRIEMRELLLKIESTQTKLSGQLGQIKAAAHSAKQVAN